MNKLFGIIIAIVLIIIVFAVGFWSGGGGSAITCEEEFWSQPVSFNESVNAEIKVCDDVLLYDGFIGDNDFDQLLSAVQSEGVPREIQIRSQGGFTKVGIKMGDFVFDNGIDVRVIDICFSSCANYIFPAGKNKFIEKDAIVGWHGSAIQDDVLALSEDKTGEELFREAITKSLFDAIESLPEEQRQLARMDAEESIEYEIQQRQKDIEEERVFYEKIGVNQDITVFGLLPENYETYYKANIIEEEYGEYGGWILSLEDMAEFGVENIQYLGDGEYPERNDYYGLRLKLLSR
ncbi:MAG: hypothetical protein OXU73_01460 [Candidatus Campbellbacteria bacterium]|nr:hypothetical protein [Candidatus Campbellbacteria bacterium]